MTKAVTKNPKNVERGKKAYENHFKKIKEGILSSIESTPSSGDLTTTATPKSTTATTTPTPTSTAATTTATPSFTTSFTLLGTGAIAVIIFAGYFYINRKPAPAKPEQAPQPTKSAAFFHMQ